MKFYQQQIYGSLVIVALWATAIALLDGRLEPLPSRSNTILTDSKYEQQARVIHEPRDPKATGETARHHHKDPNGSERQTEIDFADMSKAVIEYSIFGKPYRVTEARKDGSCMVFQLDPMGSKQIKIESKRPDGTLKSLVQPNENGGLERVFYQADGNTKACRQELKKDGSLSAEIFYQDGKTLRARYKLEAQPEKETQTGDQGYQPPQPSNAVLQIFDKQGKLVAEEIISSTSDPEYGDCGNCQYNQETVSVKRFWDSGALHFQQEWQAYPNSEPTLQSAAEFATDGKTKLQSLLTCYEKVGKEHAQQRIDSFDKDGKILKSQYLGSNHNVIMETKAGEAAASFPNGKSLSSPLLEAPSFKSMPKDFFSNKLEEHRLQQILSN